MSKFFSQQPIILGSSSQARIKLLASLGLDFEIIPALCNEEKLKEDFASASMLKLASTLARCKALDVSHRYPSHFVIAADQLCIFENRHLGKPLDHATAVSNLRLLRGKTHQQLAAYCIVKGGTVLWEEHDIATLTMNALSDDTIEAYLRSEQPYQSCGAYNYEGVAKWLFQEVQGDESTILGLPLVPLTRALIRIKAVSLLPPYQET
ncbi:septum formation protein [Legionella lansingensis]|uniref:Nucleoside triphosphate pyrophosphatase n=1 Tax=Legionella lansingensis TaxID=45067 RepID=A0A0W0VUP7_9GAMM|nr:Maf family nucleotide pyrophosphatase [Legionella lansingensis]KTD23786.1 Maf-like protein [Legionella lansingensis]SNV47288.1 septum formation protein [Legionella lansingensis]